MIIFHESGVILCWDGQKKKKKSIYLKNARVVVKDTFPMFKMSFSFT